MNEKMPMAIEGMPEAGVQVDMFGVEHRFTPKGKGEVTQIRMDDAMKLEQVKKTE